MNPINEETPSIAMLGVFEFDFRPSHRRVFERQ